MKKTKRFKLNTDGEITYTPAEKDIQHTIALMLMYDGWMVMRVNSGKAKLNGQMVSFYELLNFNRMSKGFPDLVAYKGNDYVLIEVKSEKGRLSKSQKMFTDVTNHFDLNHLVINNMDDAIDIVNIIHAEFDKKSAIKD